MQREVTRTRLALAACCLAALATAEGCAGDDAPPRYPVRGRVTVDGKPLAEAKVVFHAMGDAPREIAKPMGICDAQGQFELTTIATGDGAPAGEYAITVELREPRQRGDEMVRDGPNVLAAKFGKAETTPLKYDVVAGDNEIPPLEVARK